MKADPGVTGWASWDCSGRAILSATSTIAALNPDPREQGSAQRSGGLPFGQMRIRSGNRPDSTWSCPPCGAVSKLVCQLSARSILWLPKQLDGRELTQAGRHCNLSGANLVSTDKNKVRIMDLRISGR
jgi:hypothetical protein